MTPDRVHLICHANPIRKDLERFGFSTLDDYLRTARGALPPPLKLTCSEPLLLAPENADAGGRSDDAARVRDLNRALADPRTWGIVAAAGGAYFLRILPELDFSPLARRPHPFFAFGFSEMTPLVNLVASYRCGRGVYWLCPNYVGWKVAPAATARDVFAEFWKRLPETAARLGGGVRRGAGALAADAARFDPLAPRGLCGRLVSGSLTADAVRIVGGCLSVLAAAATGAPLRRVRVRERWLLLEDVNEAPHRIDRALAALRIAGWLDQIAGVLVGNFHTREQRQSEQVVEFLRMHLRHRPRTPIVVTEDVGHVWPIAPVPLNRRLRIERGRGGALSLAL